MSHQTISFVKSGIRIAGYIALGHVAALTAAPWAMSMDVAAALLVVSELLGIYEEIGH